MRIVFSIGCFFISVALYCQIEISGIVRDSVSQELLPFASISLTQKLLGTTTNEYGQFKVLLPTSSESDTLNFSFMGYKSAKIAIKNCPSFLEINLAPFTIQMEEVVISPKTAQYYIKQFQIYRDSNYVNTPFGTTAFYREQIKENGDHIMHSEAIFKSYYPDYRGEKKNQHQVVSVSYTHLTLPTTSRV